MPQSQVPSPELAASAARLELLRKARGIRSVRAFALRCGLTVTATQSYFRGRTAPGAASMRKIAEALAVSIDWLARGEGPMDYLPVGAKTPAGFVIDAGRPVPLPQFSDIDLPLLAECLAAVDALNKKLTPLERVNAMAALYETLKQQETARAEKAKAPST